MSNEEPPVPEEVLTSAKDQLDEEEISLADNEEILHTLSELTPVYENNRSYFVLGNYDREPIRRLNLVADRLIVVAVSHYQIDRPTAGGRTGKQLQQSLSTAGRTPTLSGWSTSEGSGTTASRSSA